MADLRKIVRLTRLSRDKDLLPWAKLLVEDLMRQLYEIAEMIDMLTGGGMPVGPHELLSTEHTDTVPGSPVRGDLVVANSTPEWTRLHLGTGILKSNGLDVLWGLIAKSDLPSVVAFEDESNDFSLPQQFQSYLDLQSIATPTNPDTNEMRLYVNKTGSVIELRVRAPDGTECVLCSKTLPVSGQTLSLNWVE